MRRKRNVWYSITAYREDNDPNLWYSSTHGWFEPQYDENGHGLPSNGCYCSHQECNTVKRMARAYRHLEAAMPNSEIVVRKWFIRNGKRLATTYVSKKV